MMNLQAYLEQFTGDVDPYQQAINILNTMNSIPRRHVIDVPDDEGDNLVTCRVCGDRYHDASQSMCWACREQQMIDDAVPDNWLMDGIDQLPSMTDDIQGFHRGNDQLDDEDEDYG